MFIGVLLILVGLIFFIAGLAYSNNWHKSEGIFTGIVSDYFILALIFEGILIIFDKLPYWVTKNTLIIISLICFFYGYENIIDELKNSR
jgi:hypothetical protein